MKKRSKYFASIPVRFADTDANGHVFFANYLTYFDTALLEYLKALKYDFQRLMDQGLNMYYVEATTRFESSASYGDTLDVYVEIPKFGNSSFTCEFRIYENASGRFVNAGHIVAVLVNLETEKPEEVPQDFKDAVRAFERQDQ